MSKETINKTSVILRSIVKTVFSGLKTFVTQFGEPGLIQQARVGRSMGILKQHRKEQLKHASLTNRLESYRMELQELRNRRELDNEQMQVLCKNVNSLIKESKND